MESPTVRTFTLAVAAFFFSIPAWGQQIQKPTIVPQDSWTYLITTEKNRVSHQSQTEFTVVRAESSNILISIRDAGSNLPPREQLVGADWSRVRNVDGKQTVVNRPLDFPLAVGKKWIIDYTDDHPENRALANEHLHEPYVVTGWETVTVPAGTFKALKIEVDGQWTADVAPRVAGAVGGSVDPQGSMMVMRSDRTTPQQVSGRLYKAFWYAPEVKRFVKSDEEYFSTQDVLSERYLGELQTYKVSQ